MAADPRRAVPRTDVLLAEPRIAAATERLGRSVVKAAVGAAQDRARRGEIAPAEVADAAARALAGPATTLRPVLNATGVVVHTNLGRAPLSAAAQAALVTAAGYVDVEYDLATGRRATRGRGALAALLATVPGAGDALVVNNGAAALVLAATALARGREMVISRGELVEIGDGFRLPDLLVATGARIREVGTTNRTVLGDYADAIGPDTAFVLKVHPANFRVEGFTAAVDVRALATLGAPVVVDVGSAPARCAGAVLVTASGVKLLGGPQAGLVLGDAALVAQLRRHPLARALRADKLTLAALEATLRGPTPPVRAAVGADAELLRARATTLAGELAAAGVDAVAVPSDGAVGGGGAPGLRLPGAAVSLPAAYAGRLRTGDPAVVGRVERGRCLLDLRCVPAAADEVLLAAVRAVQPAGPEC